MTCTNAADLPGGEIMSLACMHPSRCATNVPQGHHSGAVPEVSEAGPKSLTCTNTPGRRRARTDDLRIENEQAACPSQCAIKCAIWPFSGTARGA